MECQRGVGVINVVQEPRAEPLHLTEAKAHLRVDTTDEDALISVLVSAARMRAEAILQRALVLQTLELVLDYWFDVVRLDRSPVMKFLSAQYKDFNGTLQTLSPSVYQVDTKSEPGRFSRGYAQVWPQLRGGEDLNSVVLSYQAGYLAPAVVDATANTLTVGDNPFVDTDKVYVSQSGGAVPVPLAANLVPYYVVNTAGNAFKLALTSGGVAIDLTDTGTGTVFVSKRRFPDAIKQAMLLMLSFWFDNRDAVNVGNLVTKIPEGAAALLAPYRMRSFG